MYIFFLVLVLAAVLLERYSMKNALRGVSHESEPSSSTVEPDEHFTVTARITNSSRRIVPFLKVQESVPRELTVHASEVRLTPPEESVFGADASARISYSLYLLPRQRVTRRFEASLPARGRYFLRGATLYGGDFLGLSDTVGYYNATTEIVVVPRELPSPPLDEALGGFLGDISVRRFIMEDPVLTLGFREYTGSEPQKMISWAQSARSGQLMVKKYDYTLELTVTVLLNVEREGQTPDSALTERCFSLARTVCQRLEDMHIKYGFITNATAAGALSLWSSVGDGLGGRHFTSILEGLGRATYDSTEPLAAMLERAAHAAETGRSHVLITPEPSAACAAGVRRLETATGGRVFAVYASEVE